MNVTAGGGSSLGLPALIFLGLDPSVANGTNRIAIIVQNIGAVTSFRTSGMRGLRQSLWLSAWSVPGAIIGTLVAVRISDAWFQIAVGIVNILTVIVIFLPKSKNNSDHFDDPRQKLLVGITLFFVGIYGGFIQLSVGFLLMATLYRLSRMNLVLVNMHKVTIALIYNIPSLAIFWWTGNVQFLPGFVLGLGSATGGWWSAKVQIKRGEGFIKFVLAIALVVISLKLFGIF
jgi:uncharacterized membrane protein YfcA